MELPVLGEWVGDLIGSKLKLGPTAISNFVILIIYNYS